MLTEKLAVRPYLQQPPIIPQIQGKGSTGFQLIKLGNAVTQSRPDLLPRLPVSVCGTVTLEAHNEAFLGSLASCNPPCPWTQGPQLSESPLRAARRIYLASLLRP